MENSLFTAETVIDQTLLKEGFRVMMRHSWRRYVYAVLILCLLGLGGYSIYEAVYWSSVGYSPAWRRFGPLAAVSFVFAVLLIVKLITAPGAAARKYVKRIEVVLGENSELKVRYSFTDSVIYEESSSEEKRETAYDQVVAVYETEHGIILRRKMNLFEAIAKSGIEGGTLSEFRAFLQSKMPNAKFILKK
jgi:hypothetical protein